MAALCCILLATSFERLRGVAQVIGLLTTNELNKATENDVAPTNLHPLPK